MAAASTEVNIDDEESDSGMVVVQSPAPVPAVAVQQVPQQTGKHPGQTSVRIQTSKRKRKPTPPLPVELIRPPVPMHKEEVIASMPSFFLVYSSSEYSFSFFADDGGTSW